MTAAATLRLLADLIDQGRPCDYVGVGVDSVTVIVSNPISGARWRETLDEHPEIHDADVRVVDTIGAAS